MEDVSVITVRKAYEELQRDGFIDTAVGRGSFVAERNREFYMEEQQRLAEEHLRQAAEIGEDILYRGGITWTML